MPSNRRSKTAVPDSGQPKRLSRQALARRALARLAVLTIVLATISCASRQLRPGTGDVSFRLVWEGEADLDLHVTDPLGRHTGIVLASPRGTPEEQLAAARAALAAQIDREPGVHAAAGPPAGILDVDCNGAQHQICPKPIENVYWPTDTAPRGAYVFWVHLFQPLLETGLFDHVDFTLEVRRGQAVVERHQGVVANDERTSTRFSHLY